MKEFLGSLFIHFFVAFGVLLGGCIIGGIGAFIGGQPPIHWITTLADRLKIWALVAAIGGTFDTITVFEKGFLEGTHEDVIKQVLYILSAFFGALSGSRLVHWLLGGEMQ